MKEFNRRQGNPIDPESTGQRKTGPWEAGEGTHGISKPQPEQAKPQQGRGERKPLRGHTEDQAGPADIDVNSANTGDLGSPEVGLKDKSPVKDPPKRRWHVGAEGGELHGYGEDEDRGASKDKSP